MKALNFNKNSWHYRLVSKLKLYEAPHQQDIWGDGELYTVSGDSGDICTYSKRVLFALFLVIVGIVFFATVSNIVIHTLLGIYFSVLVGQWFFTEVGNVGMILSGAGVIFTGVYMAFKAFDHYNEKNLNKHKSPKSDTFLSNAYRAWKDKFCVPINFK